MKKKRKFSHYLVEVNYKSGKKGECVALKYVNAKKAYDLQSDQEVNSVSLFIYLDKMNRVTLHTKGA